MIDLLKLGDRTYCIDSPTKVGIFLLDERNVCVIDTGKSKQFAKVIDNILVKHNWNLKFKIYY